MTARCTLVKWSMFMVPTIGTYVRAGAAGGRKFARSAICVLSTKTYISSDDVMTASASLVQHATVCDPRSVGGDELTAEVPYYSCACVWVRRVGMSKPTSATADSGLAAASPTAPSPTAGAGSAASEEARAKALKKARRVRVMFQPVGAAPLMKKNKFKIDLDEPFAVVRAACGPTAQSAARMTGVCLQVVRFLRKMLHMAESDSLVRACRIARC